MLDDTTSFSPSLLRCCLHHFLLIRFKRKESSFKWTRVENSKKNVVFLRLNYASELRETLKFKRFTFFYIFFDTYKENIKFIVWNLWNRICDKDLRSEGRKCWFARLFIALTMCTPWTWMWSVLCMNVIIVDKKGLKINKENFVLKKNVYDR